MGRLAFLADEHVDRALILGVRANGYDVAVVGEEYPAGEDDGALMDVCEQRNLVLLTNDRDFVRLGRSRAHTGIVIYTTQTIPVGEFVGAIRQIDDHFTPRSIRNQILWLRQWA